MKQLILLLSVVLFTSCFSSYPSENWGEENVNVIESMTYDFDDFKDIGVVELDWLDESTGSSLRFEKELNDSLVSMTFSVAVDPAELLAPEFYIKLDGEAEKFSFDTMQVTPINNQITTVDVYEDGSSTTTSTSDAYKLYVGSFTLSRKIQRAIKKAQTLKFRFYTNQSPITFRLHSVLLKGVRAQNKVYIDETLVLKVTSRLTLLQELIRISSKVEYDEHARKYRMQQGTPCVFYPESLVRQEHSYKNY